MVLLAQYLLCCCFFMLSSGLPQKKPKQKKPKEKMDWPTPLPTMIPHEEATPFFVFDGIDYDELPPALSNAHYDCEGEYMRCLQNTNYLHYVCVFVATAEFYGYTLSFCTMEVNNCRNRMWWNNGVYGTFYSNDEYFYQGDGHKCEHSNWAWETWKQRRAIFFEHPSLYEMFQNNTEAPLKLNNN